MSQAAYPDDVIRIAVDVFERRLIDHTGLVNRINSITSNPMNRAAMFEQVWELLKISHKLLATLELKPMTKTATRLRGELRSQARETPAFKRTSAQFGRIHQDLRVRLFDLHRKQLLFGTAEAVVRQAAFNRARELNALSRGAVL